jgi:hypothetical protein
VRAVATRAAGNVLYMRWATDDGEWAVERVAVSLAGAGSVTWYRVHRHGVLYRHCRSLQALAAAGVPLHDLGPVALSACDGQNHPAPSS